MSIKKGQVYQERDKRAKGRCVRTLQEEMRGKRKFWRVANVVSGRETFIRPDILLSRFSLLD